MTIMVSLLIASALVEAGFYVLPFLWPGRKAIVPILIVTTAFAGAAVFVSQPNAMSALLLLLCVYRIFNNIRVMENRMHERYLHHVTRRTSLKLLVPQIIIGVLWFSWHQMNLATHALWAVLGFWQVAVAVLLLYATLRGLKRTLPTPVKKAYSAAELPSITIAVPARNETEDLQQCLESLIASDYPKLEIIVLDDCSQVRKTPEIIRSFAHDGVRFIKGAEPSETWLPKNQAYRRLAEEASGEYILFCGVDVRFEPKAVRALVTTMLARQKTMVSVLPQRANGVGSNFALVQAMRNWWELAPPRRLFERPPVVSSCWIISRGTLKKVGGFEAVTRAIVPEAYFARQLVWQDRYSFLRSDDVLGITTVKNTQEQRETAIRMRYPQLHRRPEQVFLITLLEVGLLLMPFAMVIAGFWWHIGAYAQIFAGIASILLLAGYVAIMAATNINGRWFRLIAFPVMILTDVGLVHYSMWRYEFSVVDWKGRNVCVPTMHAIPHLPKI
jgi:glycosyltransferase involved in cell wall biosynthesis